MKTIRVRIACAVDADGKWTAGGWSNPSSEQDFWDFVFEGGEWDGSERKYFIGATVSVPEGSNAETIEAVKVEQAT